MKKKWIVAAALVAAGASGGYSFAQQRDKVYEDWKTRYLVAAGEAVTARATGDQSAEFKADATVVQALQAAIGKTKYTNFLAGNIATDKSGQASPEAVALQLMQNQKLIEQNDRIIALLEKRSK